MKSKTEDSEQRGVQDGSSVYFIILNGGWFVAGRGHKQMSSPLADLKRPNAGRGGGSCGVSANEYSCAQGAQINFGDLTPYLTYGLWSFSGYVLTHTVTVPP